MPMRGFHADGPTILFVSLLLVAPAVVPAADGTLPSFVPRLVLSYVDPLSGETISCGEGCRRFEVPDGVELEVQVGVENNGGDVGDEGVAWDLWFDQRRHPFPGVDLDACHDASENRLDLDCWRAYDDRVDWEAWKDLVADVVCVPEKPGWCEDVTVRVPMDAEFDGSRGRGVYSFAVWVDRFKVIGEDNEFDNFRGPVRVKVVPAESTAPAAGSNAAESAPEGLVRAGSSPQPYTVLTFPAHAETGFTLSSQKSRGVLEFRAVYPGTVIVEVEQSGVYENMVVQIRRVLTEEVLAESNGKGRLKFTGKIGLLDLKDDRLFEVVVMPAHGTRGVRGTINVSYPSRASYRITE
jgi:hypothetical protein